MKEFSWRSTIAVTLLLLTACGGGDSGSPSSGGQGGSSTTPPTPAPPAPTVTFSGNSISSTAESSGGHQDNTSITFSIANAPAAGVWYRTTQTGTAVRVSDLVFSGPSSGQVRIGVWAPQQVGAGTYTSTVRVEICGDSNCASQISGSPWTISVSYIVTGSVGANSEVRWFTPTSEPFVYPVDRESAPTVPLDFFAYYAPVTGLWLASVEPTSGVILDIALSEATVESEGLNVRGVFDVRLAPPAALGSGVWYDRMRVMACYDARCAHVVPGSEYEFDISMIVHAVSGVHYTRRSWLLENGATELVWSATNGSLLVASDRSNAMEARVVTIRPDVPTPAASWTSPGERILKLAVSGDGSNLFVNTFYPLPSSMKSSVRRLSLPDLVERSVQELQQRGLYAIPDRVSDMLVPAGQSGSVLAALYSIEDNGIHVLDGAGVSRGIDPVAGYPAHPRLLERGEAPDIFYSVRGETDDAGGRLDRVRLSGGEVQLVSSFPLQGRLREARYGDGHLFLRDGRILVATTGAEAGRLSVPEGWALRALVADAAHSRVFALAHNYFVLSFDISTGKLLAMAPLQVEAARVSEEDNAKIILWGDDGVAVADGTNLVLLSGAFVSAYDGAPTIVMPPGAPLPTAAASTMRTIASP